MKYTRNNVIWLCLSVILLSQTTPIHAQQVANSESDTSTFHPGFQCSPGPARDDAPSMCDANGDGQVSDGEARRYKEVTFLYHIGHGNLSTVEEMVIDGVDVNARGVKNPLKLFGIRGIDSYLPPLHLAAYRCQKPEHIMIAALLMENGADPGESADRFHRSALSYAWEFFFVGDEYAENEPNRRRDMLNMLYGQGATFPFIPLHFAARLGCEVCVKAIAQDNRGAMPSNVVEDFDLDTLNDDNMTALHYALDVRCEECVTVLVDHGARVDIQDIYGRTALHNAVYMHSPEMIETLLRGEGAANALATQDIDGRTPIDLAKVYKGTPRILRALGVPEDEWNTSAEERKVTLPPVPRERGGWQWEDKTPLDIDYCDFDVKHADSFTLEDFIRDYYSTSRPVVIRGLTEGWPAWERWTREGFTARYGNVSLMTGPIPYAQEYGRPKDSEVMEIREFVEEMQDGTPDVFDSKVDETTEPWILFDQSMATEQPEFLADYSTPSYFRLCDQYTRPQISVGSFGSGAPFHSHVGAWNAVIYGRKRWFVVPPGIAKLRDVETSQQPLSWFQSDGYRSLRDAGDVQECVQNPGEVVYVPRLWSHATINLVDTVCMAQEFCTFSPKSDPLSHYLYGSPNPRDTATRPITRLNTHIRGPVQLIPDHLVDKLEPKDVR